MKILHICRSDSGGAGLCAFRICKTLRELGTDSRMLVLEKTKEDCFISAPYTVHYNFFRFFHKLLRLLHIYVFEYDRLLRQNSLYGGCYSSIKGVVDISNHPWVQDADVIHLHWIGSFFEQEKFFLKINKPIIWSLHDENMFLGTAHYRSMVLPNDVLEKKYRKKKLSMLSRVRKMGVVFLSRYFERTFKDDPVMVGKKRCVINNSVDVSNFKIYPKSSLRRQMGIDDKNIVFAFVAANIADPRKGLDKLISAIESFQDASMQIIAIGDNSSFPKHALVYDVGPVYDSSEFSQFLSVADYFVMPSAQEAFAQAPLEAMACGLPAIVFPVSGTEELINEDNGVICDGFGVDKLINGIKIAMKKKYEPNKIREDVAVRFSPQKIAKEYLSFYHDVMKM